MSHTLLLQSPKRAKRILAVFSFALVLGSVCVQDAYAQSQASASLSGTITDPSGSAIPDAKVTLTNANRAITRTFMTRADGSYSFTLLPPEAT